MHPVLRNSLCEAFQSSTISTTDQISLALGVEFTFPVSVPPPRPEVADETPKRFWRQNEFPLCVFSRGGGGGGGEGRRIKSGEKDRLTHRNREGFSQFVFEIFRPYSYHHL